MDRRSRRVRRIEVRLDQRADRRTLVQVTFGEWPDLGVLVPRSVWEWYEGASVLGQEQIAASQRVLEGYATYGNLRRFVVRTSSR